MTTNLQVVARDPGPLHRLREVQADATAPAEILRLMIGGIGEPQSLAQIRRLWSLPHSFARWFETTHADLHAVAQKILADVRMHSFFLKPAAPKLANPDGKPHCYFSTDGKHLQYVAGIDEAGPFYIVRPHASDETRWSCAACKRDESGGLI